MFPSADVIAVAIYAAVRALCPPGKVDDMALDTAAGALDVGALVGYGGGYPRARSRCYAAVALWDAFPEAGREKIGVCVGNKPASVQSWTYSLDKKLQQGLVRWWDEDCALAVSNAVEWAMAREAPVDLPALLPANGESCAG